MSQSKQFTIHRGYRVYVPEVKDFRRDNHGCYLVHVQLSRVNGAIEERIGIPGCVAGSIHRALELSAKYAVSIIDDRMGHPIPGAQPDPIPSPATKPQRISPEPVPTTTALRAAVNVARQLMDTALVLPVLQRELARRVYIEALQALQGSVLDGLNAAVGSQVRSARTR